MNAKLITTALFVSLLVISCKKDCDEPIPDQCQLIDYDASYYEPVCGCDGITYTNNLVAECQYGILDYSEGKCK